MTQFWQFCCSGHCIQHEFLSKCEPLTRRGLAKKARKWNERRTRRLTRSIRAERATKAPEFGSFVNGAALKPPEISCFQRILWSPSLPRFTRRPPYRDRGGRPHPLTFKTSSPPTTARLLYTSSLRRLSRRRTIHWCHLENWRHLISFGDSGVLGTAALEYIKIIKSTRDQIIKKGSLSFSVKNWTSGFWGKTAIKLRGHPVF